MEDTSVGIFEVFKMGHLTSSQLDALSLEDIRKQYSLLLPITDRSQLLDSCQLAGLPQPGHIVVDKTHFQEMVAREVRKQVDTAIRQHQARRDEPIFRAHDAFARDREMVSTLLRDQVGAQREQLQALVAMHMHRGKEKHELLSDLKHFIEEDQRLWSRILAHPYFRRLDDDGDNDSGNNNGDGGEPHGQDPLSAGFTPAQTPEPQMPPP